MKNFILIIQLSFIISVSLSGQLQDIVKTTGITSELHRANIGKIIFTSKSIPLEELKETDFLNTYGLTNKSDLFITVFMNNSVTNYMHILAPDLSASELVKKGNYQFNLIVDNRLIYSSNLLPGAPYARIQDTATIFSKPFIDNKSPYGLWSQSFWNRFMNNGGDSVLTEGNHLLKMEIRPYVQSGAGLKVGDIIASGTVNLKVNRKPDINLAAVL